MKKLERMELREYMPKSDAELIRERAQERRPTWEEWIRALIAIERLKALGEAARHGQTMERRFRSELGQE